MPNNILISPKIIARLLLFEIGNHVRNVRPALPGKGDHCIIEKLPRFLDMTMDVRDCLRSLKPVGKKIRKRMSSFGMRTTNVIAPVDLLASKETIPGSLKCAVETDPESMLSLGVFIDSKDQRWKVWMRFSIEPLLLQSASSVIS